MVGVAVENDKLNQKQTECPTANCAKSATDTLIELIDFKLSLCHEFIIKLDADSFPVSTYMEHSIRREKPLYLGVGAIRIDRNSIADSVAANQ